MNNRQLSGLPNIGLTCYLNCVLQLLFAAQQLRERVITWINQQKGVEQTHYIIFLLADIFKGMKQSWKRRKMEKLLRNLVVALKLHIYTQNDALRTINSLLQHIERSIDIQDLFGIEYSQRCSCYQESFILNTRHETDQVEKCGRCSNKLDKKILNSPKYRLFVSTASNPQKILKDVEGLYGYQLIGRIIYSGNGSSGHYMCIRAHGKQQYLFNDDIMKRVKTQTISQLQDFDNRILLYVQLKQEMKDSERSLEQEQYIHHTVEEEEEFKKKKDGFVLKSFKRILKILSFLGTIVSCFIPKCIENILKRVFTIGKKKGTQANKNGKNETNSSKS